MLVWLLCSGAQRSAQRDSTEALRPQDVTHDEHPQHPQDTPRSSSIILQHALQGSYLLAEPKDGTVVAHPLRGSNNAWALESTKDGAVSIRDVRGYYLAADANNQARLMHETSPQQFTEAHAATASSGGATSWYLRSVRDDEATALIPHVTAAGRAHTLENVQAGCFLAVGSSAPRATVMNDSTVVCQQWPREEQLWLLDNTDTVLTRLPSLATAGPASPPAQAYKAIENMLQPERYGGKVTQVLGWMIASLILTLVGLLSCLFCFVKKSKQPGEEPQDQGCFWAREAPTRETIT